MKSFPILLILFGTLLLVPYGAVHVHGLEYVDEEKGFLIEYPSGWTSENEFVLLDGIEYLVTFYDDLDGWTSMLEVRYHPETSFIFIWRK